jgi:hypothetical protein
MESTIVVTTVNRWAIHGRKRGGNHGGNAGHGRVQADHGRGDAALLKNDRQQGQPEADGDSHGGDRR